MKFIGAWLGKFEKALEPAQWLVSLLLVGIILGSVYLLFSKNAVARTSWAAWMILP